LAFSGTTRIYKTGVEFDDFSFGAVTAWQVKFPMAIAVERLHDTAASLFYGLEPYFLLVDDIRVQRTQQQ